MLSRHTLVAALMATSVTAAVAQGRVSCASGVAEVSFGVADLDCVQCTVHSGSGSTWVEYGAEPTVKRVSGGDDGLRPGDVIVSIDGALITTTAGARRFSAPTAGKTVVMTVRRNGRQTKFDMTPTVRCSRGVAFVPSVQFDTLRAGRLMQRGGAAAGGALDSSLQGRGTRFRINYDSSGNYIVRDVAADSILRAGGRVNYTFGRGSRIQADSVSAGSFSSGGSGGGSGGGRAVAQGRGGFAGGVSVRATRSDTVMASSDERPSRVALRASNDSVMRVRGGVAVGGFARSGDVSAARIATMDSAAAVNGAQIRGALRQRLAQSQAYFDSGTQVRASRTDSLARATSGSGSQLAWRFGRSDSAAPRFAAPAISSGWLGFGLECTDCSVRTGSDGRRIWTFSAAPVVAGIETDSPAASAGLEVGDVIRSIDGMALTTTAGAARFSAVRPGDKIRMVVDRKGRQHEMMVTVGKRVVRA